MEIYVKKIISKFYAFFLLFMHDFMRYVDFTCRPIADSNTASDDVTNYILVLML